VLKKARIGKEPELRKLETDIEAAEVLRVREQGAQALREANDLVTGVCLRVCVCVYARVCVCVRERLIHREGCTGTTA